MFNQKNKIPYIVVPTLTETQVKQFKDVPSGAPPILKNMGVLPNKHDSFGDTSDDYNSRIKIKEHNDVVAKRDLHGCDGDATEVTIDCNNGGCAEKMMCENKITKVTYNICNVDDMRKDFDNDNTMSQDQEYVTDGEVEEIVLLSSDDNHFVDELDKTSTKDGYNIQDVKSMEVASDKGNAKNESNNEVNTNSGNEIVNQVAREHAVIRNDEIISNSKHAADKTLITAKTESKGKAMDRNMDEESNIHESDMDEIMEIKYRNVYHKYLEIFYIYIYINRCIKYLYLLKH